IWDFYPLDKHLERLAEDPNSADFWIVATSHGHIVGSLNASITGASSPNILIDDIFVDPVKQRQQIASRLLADALVRIRAMRTIRTVTANIHKNNYASQKLFESHGFRFEKSDKDGNTYELPLKQPFDAPDPAAGSGLNGPREHLYDSLNIPSSQD